LLVDARALTTTPIHQPVLVLNQNYEPLNVCSLRRALLLVIGEKAEVLENNGGCVYSTNLVFDAPSVIRLYRLIRRPRPKVKLTRKEIFERDHYTCQYCGLQTGDLTVDHITPRSKGGEHTWTNVVAACRPCNHRKGDKTIQEARMKLVREPFEPRASVYYAIERRLNASLADSWVKFLPGMESPVPATTFISSSD
jgi:5-methylcytosine-specific restriction endonuclease McrA